MEETIDFFKYKSLLAKLESIKGTKKPIKDFIKEIYKLSNNLKHHDTNYREHPQTARYAFMLVSKALTYDGSVVPTNRIIVNDLSILKNKLVDRYMVSKDNIVETYEFCNTSITISPDSLEKLFKCADIIQPLTDKSFYLHLWSTKEIKLFSSSEQAARIFLKRHNPESILLEYIPFDQKKYDKTIEELQTLCDIYTPVLKEHHDTHIQ